MQNGKSLLLYSGGFDCTLQSYLLKPDILLYMDIDGYYSKKEIEHLNSREHFGKDLWVDDSLRIGKFEEPNLYLPFRNAYFILQALQYAENIYLGFNEADIAPDKDEKFIQLMSSLVEHMSNYKRIMPDIGDFTISAPFREYTKAELVAKCITKGLSVNYIRNIRTCYSARSNKGCGRCSPCIGKAVALMTNGLSIKGLFTQDPLVGFKKHFEDNWGNYAHTRTYKEFEKIYQSL